MLLFSLCKFSVPKHIQPYFLPTQSACFFSTKRSKSSSFSSRSSTRSSSSKCSPRRLCKILPMQCNWTLRDTTNFTNFFEWCPRFFRGTYCTFMLQECSLTKRKQQHLLMLITTVRVGLWRRPSRELAVLLWTFCPRALCFLALYCVIH